MHTVRSVYAENYLSDYNSQTNNFIRPKNEFYAYAKVAYYKK